MAYSPRGQEFVVADWHIISILRLPGSRISDLCGSEMYHESLSDMDILFSSLAWICLSHQEISQKKPFNDGLYSGNISQTTLVTNPTVVVVGVVVVVVVVVVVQLLFLVCCLLVRSLAPHPRSIVAHLPQRGEAVRPGEAQGAAATAAGADPWLKKTAGICWGEENTKKTAGKRTKTLICLIF